MGLFQDRKLNIDVNYYYQTWVGGRLQYLGLVAAMRGHWTLTSSIVTWLLPAGLLTQSSQHTQNESFFFIGARTSVTNYKSMAPLLRLFLRGNKSQQSWLYFINDRITEDYLCNADLNMYIFKSILPHIMCFLIIQQFNLLCCSIDLYKTLFIRPF